MIPPVASGLSALGTSGITGPIGRPTVGATGGQPSSDATVGSAGLGGVGGGTGAGFADEIGQALRGVEQTQQVADGLAQQAATGQLTDVHDYMIASTQAQLATELTVAVRNKALESFNEIMRMQV